MIAYLASSLLWSGLGLVVGFILGYAYHAWRQQ